MAKKKPVVEKEIDPKRLITAEFNVAAMQNDIASLHQRVKILEDAVYAAGETPWWRRLFRCL